VPGEAAFEALVLRHGPMVLGVCRRILGNSADAEDAFQATFLVLVRGRLPFSPASWWPTGCTGWLSDGEQARAMNAKRRVKEARAPDRRVATRTRTCSGRSAARPRSRAAGPAGKISRSIVLCDLEGKQRKEAARQLGWPEGTSPAASPPAQDSGAAAWPTRRVASSGCCRWPPSLPIQCRRACSRRP